VTGGRDFEDKLLVEAVLSEYDDSTILVHGAATGVDTIAKDYGISRGWEVRDYPAKWSLYGKAAGPIRNRQMLYTEKPDLVIAFPGGKGTRDMTEVAEQNKGQVRKVIYKKLVIYDMDGTLADDTPKSSIPVEKYYTPETVSSLEPLTKVVDDFRIDLHDPYTVTAVITGRQQKLRQVTYDWIVKHVGEKDRFDLLLRPDDSPPDYIPFWKATIATQLIAKYKPLHVIIYDDMIDILRRFNEMLKPLVKNADLYLVEKGVPQLWRP
jgi:hypothetical protein